MLVDTGAQVSLVNKQIIENRSLINPNNKITIGSIHGSEDTLGDISAIIHEHNTTIPIKLQVIENTSLKEDGILGYDIIGKKAIINGPEKTLTLNSSSSRIKFPFRTDTEISTINLININEEIQKLCEIGYLSDNEINPQYEANLHTVRSITRQINQFKVQIVPKNQK